MAHGKVIFIGAGPGAADLITLRGARLLGEADVVLYDALTDPALREFAPRAQWRHVGKRGFADSTGQQAINDLLIDEASAGKVVVRLKGGDPSVFARLEEELEALVARGIPFEVVPGVTSALAAAAQTARPLTRRGNGRSVSFATAMTRTGALHGSRTADTEVFYMGGRQLDALAARLAEVGWEPDTPVSVTSRAGWPDALHTEHRLAELHDALTTHAGRPTIVVVGAGARPLQPAAGASIAPPPCVTTPLVDGPQGPVETLRP